MANINSSESSLSKQPKLESTEQSERSINHAREYGARVYYDPSTREYGYTEPHRFPTTGELGYQENLDPLTHAPAGIAPEGTTPIARVHTHVVDDGSEFGFRSMDADKFSK